MQELLTLATILANDAEDAGNTDARIAADSVLYLVRRASRDDDTLQNLIKAVYCAGRAGGIADVASQVRRAPKAKELQALREDMRALAQKIGEYIGRSFR